MAIYIDLKCPTCMASFTQGYKISSGTKFTLGVPYARCSNCKAIVKTGKKPYSEMTQGDKEADKSMLIGHTILRALTYGAIPLLILIFWLGEDWANQNVYLVGSLSIVFGGIVSHIRVWQSYWNAIPEIEDICDREAWDELIIVL